MEEMNNVSSVVTEAEGGARLETAAPSKMPMTGGKKAALVIGILLGVLVLAYLAACVVVQTVYGDTALPRTDVLGVDCLLYTSPSPRDRQKSRMPSSA